MMNYFKSKKAEIQDAGQASIFKSDPESLAHTYHVAVDELGSALSEFGLTTNQSKVYIFLGKYGSKTAPEVSKGLGLPRTETYHLLNVLQSRGAVTAEFMSPVKYSTVPIEKMLTTLVSVEREKINTLSKQRERVLGLWNGIPSFFVGTNDEAKEKMQVLQGIQSTNNRTAFMIRDCKDEFLMFCTEKDVARFYHSDFFEILDTSRIKARFIICPAKKIPNFISSADKSLVRILQGGKSDSTCFIVKDCDEVLLFTKNASHIANEVTAIWTNSKPVIEPMRMLFDCCWEKSEIKY
jgi:HTH-type transcriptional regulator, sugar sensing transcriptional regulator